MSDKSYDPRDVEAVEYTHELFERDQQRLKQMGEALRVRFNVPLGQSVEEYLTPRLRSGEIDEDRQIEEWVYLHTAVTGFNEEFFKGTT